MRSVHLQGMVFITSMLVLDRNSRQASQHKSSHRRGINQPRGMTRGDSLRGDLGALSAGFLHHQLLNKEGNGTVVLALEIGAGDAGVGGVGSGRDLGRPGVRTKGLGPFFAVGDVVEEEAVGVDGADGAVGFLRWGVRGGDLGREEKNDWMTYVAVIPVGRNSAKGPDEALADVGDKGRDEDQFGHPASLAGRLSLSLAKAL
jgi:hypothetical protein